MQKLLFQQICQDVLNFFLLNTLIIIIIYIIIIIIIIIINAQKCIGCRLGNMIINHLLFADDAIVFAPSAKGLQQLLEICSDFAVSHNVVFNVNKSQCLVIMSKHDLIGHPLFHLSGAPQPYTDCYKYLGQLINSSLSDDTDIMKQTRSLYARSNMIIRKFASASLSTKSMLFNAYYTPVRSGVRCINTPIVN